MIYSSRLSRALRKLFLAFVILAMGIGFVLVSYLDPNGAPDRGVSIEGTVEEIQTYSSDNRVAIKYEVGSEEFIEEVNKYDTNYIRPLKIGDSVDLVYEKGQPGDAVPILKEQDMILRYVSWFLVVIGIFLVIWSFFTPKKTKRRRRIDQKSSVPHALFYRRTGSVRVQFVIYKTFSMAVITDTHLFYSDYVYKRTLKDLLAASEEGKVVHLIEHLLKARYTKKTFNQISRSSIRSLKAAKGRIYYTDYQGVERRLSLLGAGSGQESETIIKAIAAKLFPGVQPIKVENEVKGFGNRLRKSYSLVYQR